MLSKRLCLKCLDLVESADFPRVACVHLDLLVCVLLLQHLALLLVETSEQV